jgi:fructoselysine-6-P-deglycase FrlB-like protein
MGIKKEVKRIISDVTKTSSSLKHVIWVAAGGSNGGFYPAHYFVTHESQKISSQMFTSNEFVMAPPIYLGVDTLVVICSMRGTPETCRAAHVAKDAGAWTVGLYIQESDLTRTCDYVISYDSIAVDQSKIACENAAIALMVAIDLVNTREGYKYYDAAIQAFEQLDSLYRGAIRSTRKSADEWAKKNIDSSIIYVIGSGPAFGAAYIFSICNIEEMLQIASPTVNSCEFFHGPLEIIENNTSVFQLVSVGRARPADERVTRFLKKYSNNKLYILDGVDIGLGKLSSNVVEYFNQLLFSPILNNVYTRALSAATGKDYRTRTYMWKVKY